ncbi:MAG TPA: ABC transporter substrate-binding protein [Candidatus Binatus sp.]|nr:ABC transporter substrate-binding protein [Candidatus Binatus sp.]
MNLCFRFATVFLILIVVSCASAQEKPKIYFGASSKTLGYGPLWVAQKKGFLEQQGLDGELVLLRGTPMNVQALAANSLHVGSGGAEAFYEAVERGLDLVMIGGIINGLTHDIIAGKKYKSIEELRGATFGASSLTSGTVTAMKQALRAKGLEYPRDYKILVLAGGSSANLAALQSGQIAATTVAIPLNYVAEESGLNVVGRLIDAVPEFELSALAVKRSWAEKNRSVVVRFMKAIALTHRWMFDNKEAAVEFLAKEMQLKADYARRGWEYYTKNKIWDPNGDLSLKGTDYAIRIYMELINAKAPLTGLTKYVDQSYLSDAVKDLPRRP